MTNPANPHNLTEQGRAYFGVAATMVATPEFTLEHNLPFNPFIEGTAQHAAYQIHLVERQERYLAKYSKLEDIVVPDIPMKRRLNQPPFRPEFETVNDINLRLRGTVILVGPEPFYVDQIIEARNDYLLIMHGQKTKGKLWYKQAKHLDLRTPDPQYIIVRDRPAFLMRSPVRQQSQGLHHNNIQARLAGSGQTIRPEVNEIIANLTPGALDTVVWNPMYEELMIKAKAFPSIRLNQHVAFFTEGKTVVAEYKGRRLGTVEKNCVTVDAADYKRPWIHRDLSSVNCEVRHG